MVKKCTPNCHVALVLQLKTETKDREEYPVNMVEDKAWVIFQAHVVVKKPMQQSMNNSIFKNALHGPRSGTKM